MTRPGTDFTWRHEVQTKSGLALVQKTLLGSTAIMHFLLPLSQPTLMKHCRSADCIRHTIRRIKREPSIHQLINEFDAKAYYKICKALIDVLTEQQGLHTTRNLTGASEFFRLSHLFLW